MTTTVSVPVHGTTTVRVHLPGSDVVAVEVGGTITTQVGVLRGEAGAAGANGTDGADGDMVGPGYVSGRYYYSGIVPSNSNTATNSRSPGRLYAVPFYVRAASITLSCIGAMMNASTSGLHASFGIYANNNGVPGSRLYQLGVSNVSTSMSEAFVTTSASLARGIYWLVMVMENGGSYTVQTIGTTGANVLFGDDSPTASGPSAMYVSLSWPNGDTEPATFPTTFGTPTYETPTNGMDLMFVRIA